MPKQKFYTPYDRPKPVISSCFTPSKTEQQFEYETNINNIVKGCVQSSLPSQVQQAIYNFHLTGNEFQDQLNNTQEVINYFEQLPVKAKEYFSYKPQNMLDFVKNSDNFEKAYDLGLIDKPTYFARKQAFKELQSNLSDDTNSQPSTVISEGTQTINQSTAD